MQTLDTRLTSSKPNLVEQLHSQLLIVEKEVELQDYWRVFSSSDTAPRVVHAIIREVMFDIWTYQRHVNEAVFTAVGRHGTEIEEQSLMKALIAVQIEETGHGRMAMLDYVALGGSQEYASTARPSPASTNLIATIRYLGEREKPLCHLGYMYFFEAFTTIMTRKVSPILEAADYPEDRLEFINLHGEEDVRHTDMLCNTILECTHRYPSCEDDIHFGFECFRGVYPHPIWSSAFQRALKSDRVCHGLS